MESPPRSASSSPASLSLVVVPLRPHVETLRCPRPPAKTSSERGRAFRARKKQQQETIAKQNAGLVKEIRALVAKKAVYEASFLRAAHTPQGSLERLVREYYKVFDHGYRASGCAQCPRCACNKPLARRALAQTAFVMQAVDEDARIGDARGRAALIEQWRKYTAAHSKYQGKVLRVEFLGTEEEPVIVVHSQVITGISMLTLESMFPHVLQDVDLVHKLDGLDVIYDCAARFAFSSSGRIGSADFDIDFIGGLQRAGLSLYDVTRMLGIVPM